MVKHATHPDRADTRAAIWLARLKEAHAALIGAIGELAQATSGPFPPGRRALVELRWAVSQAQTMCVGFGQATATVIERE
jgi:hypothetical protein